MLWTSASRKGLFTTERESRIVRVGFLRLAWRRISVYLVTEMLNRTHGFIHCTLYIVSCWLWTSVAWEILVWLRSNPVALSWIFRYKTNTWWYFICLAFFYRQVLEDSFCYFSLKKYCSFFIIRETVFLLGTFQLKSTWDSWSSKISYNSVTIT